MSAKHTSLAVIASIAMGFGALAAASHAAPNGGGSSNSKGRNPANCKAKTAFGDTLERGTRKTYTGNYPDTGAQYRHFSSCRQNGTMCEYHYSEGKLLWKKCTTGRVLEPETVTPADPPTSAEQPAASTPVPPFDQPSAGTAAPQPATVGDGSSPEGSPPEDPSRAAGGNAADPAELAAS